MSGDKPSDAEGWEGLAEDEPTGGALAPSEALEAALEEASNAIGGEKKQAAEARSSSADEAMLEALSTELQALKSEYETALEEQEKAKDQQLRLQAEFDNFRRRTLKDKQEAQLYGHQNFVKDLLATVDNLDRAIEHSEQSSVDDVQSLLQGVELVRRELAAVLGRFGVSQIEAAGKPFDPAYHEAMAQVPNADLPANTVVDVLQTGYQLRDRMLRPARVVVSKVPEEQAETVSDGGGEGAPE